VPPLLHPNAPALQIFTPAADQPGDPGVDRNPNAHHLAAALARHERGLDVGIETDLLALPRHVVNARVVPLVA
jgi:hypothetical protein